MINLHVTLHVVALRTVDEFGIENPLGDKRSQVTLNLK
jgi:hypothetical protein